MKSPETKGLFLFKLVEAAGIEPAFLRKLYHKNQHLTIGIMVPESVWSPSSFPFYFSQNYPQPVRVLLHVPFCHGLPSMSQEFLYPIHSHSVNGLRCAAVPRTLIEGYSDTHFACDAVPKLPGV